MGHSVIQVSPLKISKKLLKNKKGLNLQHGILHGKKSFIKKF